MHCAHFAANTCRSCGLLATPYALQLQQKEQQLAKVLAPFSPFNFLPAIASPSARFRNKAKMVVSGHSEAPVLGIVNHLAKAVDLVDCPLYPAEFETAFEKIRHFIQIAKLQPYDIESKKGELKYILLSQSFDSGQWLLRFVLRSQNHVAAIRKHLPALQASWPELTVCSVNLQPEHKAVLEGDIEILMTEQSMLSEKLNDVPLYLQPHSFFQTNPMLAASLYQTARDWTANLPLVNIWDLFCGTGGFALHLAAAGRVLTGIEISESAIACASRSASELGLENIHFQALDAVAFAKAQQSRPDLLVVNPPRRGLGRELCGTVTRLQPQWLLYSSCNPSSLCTDLALLSQYKLQKVQLFDFFPHTEHAEVLCLLQISTTINSPLL